jgi:hypothetical protein
MRLLWLSTLILLAVPVAAKSTPRNWVYGVYVDLGYLKSDNDPDNRTWRFKSTTYELDRLKADYALAFVKKEPSESARWGFEIALQTGVDTEGLVTSPPPPALEPVDNAKDWTHFAPTYVSYLFPAGNGLTVTGGLLSGHIAYESYRSLPNPNYTRGYLTDNVPYFAWAIQASYPFNDRFTAELILLTGYNYLTNPNNAPSWGAQLAWRPRDGVAVTRRSGTGVSSRTRLWNGDPGGTSWRRLSILATNARRGCPAPRTIDGCPGRSGPA